MTSQPQRMVSCLREIFSQQQSQEAPDSELLRRFVETGHGDAFASLLQRHGPMVLALARRVVRDHQLAEDVFQAAFLILARQARTIRGPHSLAAFLHRVTLRLALRTHQSRQRRRQQEAGAFPRSSPDPLDELTAREFLTLLDEELNRLPEKYRLPLILCHLEGLTQEQAATRLGLSPGSVKGMLERGRGLLRKRLAQRGLASGAGLAGVLELSGRVQAVPPALIQATLQGVLTGQAASRAAAELVERAIQMMFLAQRKGVCLAVLLVGVLGLGAGLWGAFFAHQEAPATEFPPVLAADLPEQPRARRVDLHGDPLPDGASLRLGTVQLRAVAAELVLSPDGRTLIGVQDGKFVTTWDVPSGKRKETRELTDSIWGRTVLSPDGRLLATDADYGALKVWDVQTGKLVYQPATRKDHFIDGAFSSDGKRLAAFGKPEGGNHWIKVWDMANGQQTFAREFRTEGGKQLLCFTPDGRKLFAAFATSTVEGEEFCWDLATGQQLWQAKQSSIWTRSPAMTPEGILLAAKSPLDLATGKTVQLKNLPRFHWGSQLAITPDGRTLLMSNAEGIVVWDLTTGKEVQWLAGAGDTMVVSPDGKTLITSNGCLQRWDLATGKALYPDNFDQGHSDEVVAMVFSADGKRLASAAADGSVRLWDVATGRPLQVWRGHQACRRRPGLSWERDGVNALDMTADGRWIVSAGSEERLKVWDGLTGLEEVSLPFPNFGANLQGLHIYRLRISPDGKKVAGLLQAESWAPGEGGKDPSRDWLVSWDLAGQTAPSRWPIRLGKHVLHWTSANLSRDGKTAVVLNQVIQADIGKERTRLDRFRGEHWPPPPFVLSGDGLLIAGGYLLQGKEPSTEGVSIWETATGKRITQLETRTECGHLAFHPDQRFVAGSDAESIQVWDVRTGKRLARQPMPRQVRPRTRWNDQLNTSATCLAFTPDGKRLATGHSDGTILFWDLEMPVPEPLPLSRQEIASLWAELKDPDAARAWRAVWRLGDSPGEVLPFLRTNLKPAAPAEKASTDPLLADLDSDSFPKREAAQRRLQELGYAAEPALRERLKAPLPLESRRRVEAILQALADSPPPSSPEELRAVRAIAVLGRFRSPEARQLLERLTRGVPSAPLTQAARAALGGW